MAKRKQVSVSNIHRNAINAEVKRCIDAANEMFDTNYSAPRIEYTLTGRTAGWAQYARNRINLNSLLLRENGDKFINRTVGHEVAHIIAYKRYGQAGAGHGWRWKSVMRMMNLDPSRCHTYDTTNSAVYHKTKHVYRCTGCNGYMTLGPTMHKKQLASERRGSNHYSHKSCNRAKIVYIKNAGRVSQKVALGL